MVVSDATAANGLFGTVGTKWEVLNPLLSDENYGIKNSKVIIHRLNQFILRKQLAVSSLLEKLILSFLVQPSY